MLFEGGILASALVAGRVADEYSTPHAKAIVGDWIKQAQAFDWHAFVAQRSWYVYTKVFGAHSASLRFVLRSLALYIIWCVGSLTFLWAFFPVTWASVTSVWTFGTGSEQLWWIICLAGGGGLYILANAQTLYFLEILKTAPSFFKFILVAYADVLITASIALFGIPLLLTGYTWGSSWSGEADLALNIDFSDLEISKTDEVIARLEGRPVQKPKQSQDLPTYYTIRYSFSKPEEDIAQSNADYDAVVDAIDIGQVDPGVKVEKDGTIPFTRFDIFVSSLARGRAYEDEVMAYDLLKKGTHEDVRRHFCVRFATSAVSPGRGYATWAKMPDVRAEILRKCTSAGKVSVTIPAKINMGSLNIGKIYKTYLLITLDDFMTSVTSKFKSYINMSPYTIIRVEDPAQIWNIYSTLYNQGTPGGAFDQMIAKAYLRMSGADRAVVHRGLPAGTVNFAIMSTALFNILVMSVFFLMYPLVRLIGRQDVLKRFVDFERYPFSIVAFIAVVWFGGLLIVLQIL